MNLPLKLIPSFSFRLIPLLVALVGVARTTQTDPLTPGKHGLKSRNLVYTQHV